MSDQLTSSLPQDSEPQRIGRLATKAFYANTPDSWKLDTLDGDNDCGYDFQIQLVQSALMTNSFRVQLKGQIAPQLNTAGTEYSVPLKFSTVNYYARATEAILLVLCDVSSAEEAKNCNLYYCWVHDEIRRISERGAKEEQQSVTFHVPTANRLRSDTDLSRDLEHFRRLAQIGEQINGIVETEKPGLSAPERVALAEKLVPGLASRSAALLDSLADDPSSSWVEAPADSLQWFIQEARNALRTGDKGRCQTLLDRAQPLLTHAKSLEAADYWHAIGRLRLFEINDAQANAAFEQACRLSNDAETHLISWAETELRLRVQDASGPVDLSQTIERLTSSSPAAVGMRARLTAAEGRYTDALAIAETIVGIEKYVALAIISGMQAQWDLSIHACDAGLTNTLSLKEAQRLLFHILRARARYSMALGLGPSEDAPTIVPVNGAPNTNAQLLRIAWEDISESVTILRRVGWPGNVELISDIWPHTAIMLGLAKQALPLLEEAGDARPSLSGLQIGVELVAAHTNNFELALKANERQPKNDYSILRRVGLLHLSGRHTDCVNFMQSEGEQAVRNLPQLGYAISFATLSAQKILRSDLAARWTQTMEDNGALAPIHAAYRYSNSGADSPLTREAALTELCDQYDKLGRPLIIAKLLLRELDATNPEQAKKTIQVANAILEDEQLAVDEYVSLAQAFATLNQWQEMLDLSNRALETLASSDRLMACQALALDKLGYSAKAQAVLSTVIKKPQPDSLALDTYINIAAISGFTAEAIECIEYVLANEKDSNRQLQLLKYLFHLIQLSTPQSQRLVEIAWEMGKRTDQADEADEGAFLVAMFQATLPETVNLSDEMKLKFQRRMTAFTSRFPESKLIRCVSIPEEPSANQIIRAITEVTGADEGAVRAQVRLQNQLARGSTPIPYAWRPRHVLPGVPDAPSLWELSKTSQWTQRQYHLTMDDIDWPHLTATEIRRRIPLLDVIALLIIHDLGLFDKLFELFHKIAIGKTTLLHLMNLLAPMSPTRSREKCQAILEVLKANFERIEQPSANLPEEDDMDGWQAPSREIVAIAETSPQYLIYSDDLFFRAYATREADRPRWICTLDVLHAADEAGILGVSDVAQKIARLCSWRVGVVVKERYQIAIIPDDVEKTRTVRDAIECLQSDELCNALFSSIWTHEKPYRDLQGHIGALLRKLAENSANSPNTTAAIVGLWISKVKFCRDSPTPPARLIAQAIGQAVVIERPMNEITSSRLWSVYRDLIESEYGSSMDDARYDHSIALLARIAAELDRAHKLGGTRSVAERLRGGLIDGSSDHDKFTTALSNALINLAK